MQKYYNSLSLQMISPYSLLVLARYPEFLPLLYIALTLISSIVSPMKGRSCMFYILLVLRCLPECLTHVDTHWILLNEILLFQIISRSGIHGRYRVRGQLILNASPMAKITNWSWHSLLNLYPGLESITSDSKQATSPTLFLFLMYPHLEFIAYD